MNSTENASFLIFLLSTIVRTMYSMDVDGRLHKCKGKSRMANGNSFICTIHRENGLKKEDRCFNVTKKNSQLLPFLKQIGIDKGPNQSLNLIFKAKFTDNQETSLLGDISDNTLTTYPECTTSMNNIFPYNPFVLNLTSLTNDEPGSSSIKYIITAFPCRFPQGLMNCWNWRPTIAIAIIPNTTDVHVVFEPYPEASLTYIIELFKYDIDGYDLVGDRNVHSSNSKSIMFKNNTPGLSYIVKITPRIIEEPCKGNGPRGVNTESASFYIGYNKQPCAGVLIVSGDNTITNQDYLLYGVSVSLFVVVLFISFAVLNRIKAMRTRYFEVEQCCKPHSETCIRMKSMLDESFTQERPEVVEHGFCPASCQHLMKVFFRHPHKWKIIFVCPRGNITAYLRDREHLSQGALISSSLTTFYVSLDSSFYDINEIILWNGMPPLPAPLLVVLSESNDIRRNIHSNSHQSTNVQERSNISSCPLLVDESHEASVVSSANQNRGDRLLTCQKNFDGNGINATSRQDQIPGHYLNPLGNHEVCEEHAFTRPHHCPVHSENFKKPFNHHNDGHNVVNTGQNENYTSLGDSGYGYSEHSGQHQTICNSSESERPGQYKKCSSPYQTCSYRSKSEHPGHSHTLNKSSASELPRHYQPLDNSSASRGFGPQETLSDSLNDSETLMDVSNESDDDNVEDDNTRIREEILKLNGIYLTD